MRQCHSRNSFEYSFWPAKNMNLCRSTHWQHWERSRLCANVFDRFAYFQFCCCHLPTCHWKWKLSFILHCLAELSSANLGLGVCVCDTVLLPNNFKRMTFARYRHRHRHGIWHSSEANSQRGRWHKCGRVWNSRNRSWDAIAQKKGGRINAATSGKVRIAIRTEHVSSGHVEPIGHQQSALYHANVVSENGKSLHCHRIDANHTESKGIGENAFEDGSENAQRSHRHRQRNVGT